MGKGDVALLAIKACAAVVGLGLTFYFWAKKDDSSKKEEASKKASDTKAKQAEKDPSEGVFIYFGSQTGTAERFAQEIAEACEEHGITAETVDMEDFEPEEFMQHKTIVMVVATYGEGDPTDNAVEFYRWIEKPGNAEPDCLKGIKFAVMGLGNRQYVHFNSAGKSAEKHMQRLGAEMIYRRGEGDDDQDIEEDFNEWKEGGFWDALKGAVGAENGAENGSPNKTSESQDDVLSKLALEISLTDGKANPDPTVPDGGNDILGKWYFNAYQAKVVECYELRQVPDAEAGLLTKHVAIETRPGTWETADNLEVLPRNRDEDVRWFAKRLGVGERLDAFVNLRRAPSYDKAVKKPFPGGRSLYESLSCFCDLSVAPSKGAAKKFAVFASNPEERASIEKIFEDRKLLDILTAARLTLREFFEIFLTSAEIDISTFLQLCPRQRNRPYTISSSALEDSKVVTITVSLVQEKLSSLAEINGKLKDAGFLLPGMQECAASSADRRFRGITTSTLCTETKVGDSLWIYARTSTFRLPKKLSAPIVMIGAGTGLAPFHAFLREFSAEGGKRTKTYLFFGCTHRDRDFIYRDEMTKACEEPKILTELITAFSREQANKVYVQHRLRERADLLKQLLAEGAYFYVCGSNSMGAAVRDELTALIGADKSMSLDKLRKDQRFIEELW